MTNFSVIIPCYKQAHFLGKAIESILSQTLKGIEIIVVNDGSPDNTDRVARSYGSAITYLAKKNGGVASARNFGLKHAKGKMVFFLDSDDCIAPDMLEKHYIESLEHPEADVFYGDYHWMDIEGKKIKEFKLQHAPEDVFHWLLRQNRCPPCTITFRKKVLDDYGAFLTDPFYYGHEDWELLLRFAAKECGFRYVENAIAFYRRHPASVSHKPFAMWNSGYATLEVAMMHHPNCEECREIVPGRHLFLDQSCVELLRQQFRLHLRHKRVVPLLKLIPPTILKGTSIWKPLAFDAFGMIKRRLIKR